MNDSVRIHSALGQTASPSYPHLKMGDEARLDARSGTSPRTGRGRIQATARSQPKSSHRTRRLPARARPQTLRQTRSTEMPQSLPRNATTARAWRSALLLLPTLVLVSASAATDVARGESPFDDPLFRRCIDWMLSGTG